MNIVVLTGAGISAESGIHTYRDSNGLWKKYDQDIVSRKGAFETEEGKQFWKMISASLEDKQPNAAHMALVKLEEEHDVIIVTSNIDDLHEKAGSKKVIHLHGIYNKFREDNITPDVVLFGEIVRDLDIVARHLESADAFISIGTSDSVDPARNFITLINPFCKTIQINKERTENSPFFQRTYFGNATQGITMLNMLA